MGPGACFILKSCLGGGGHSPATGARKTRWRTVSQQLYARLSGSPPRRHVRWLQHYTDFPPKSGLCCGFVSEIVGLYLSGKLGPSGLFTCSQRRELVF